MMDRKTEKMLIVAVTVVLYLICTLPVSFALAINPPTVAVSSNNAMVTWTTDEPATSVVEYGQTTTLGEGKSSTQYTTDHEVTLVGLSDGEYQYRISGTDVDGNIETDDNDGENYNFTIDTQPPGKVVGLHTVARNFTSIEIAWQELGVSEYKVYRESQEIATVTETHFVDIELDMDTLYSYRVVGVDSAGNIGDVSDMLSVATLAPDTDDPVIFDVELVNLTSVSAILVWKTNENATSRVYYWKDSEVKMAEKLLYETNHSVTLQDLVDGELYTYVVSSCDKADNCVNDSQKQFFAGGDVIPPFIDVNVSRYANKDRIDVRGSTEPLAEVSIAVNGVKLRTDSADANGSFIFTQVPFEDGENILTLSAIDLAGNENEEEVSVYIDTMSPQLNVNVPAVTQDQAVIINGSVVDDNTPVTVVISVVQGDNNDAPGEVQNLAGILDQEGIKLTWDELDISDLLTYVVYREDVGPIATTTETSFIDRSVGDSKTYQYQVFAVDESCNRGPKSNPIVMMGPDDQRAAQLFSEEPNCFISHVTLNVTGNFSHSLPLYNGRNFVEVTAIDVAGNNVSESYVVLRDLEPPTLTHNLLELSPSYVDEVDIHGTVSENATVVIYVNGEESERVVTDKDLKYHATVGLDQDRLATEDDYQVLTEYGFKGTAQDIELQTMWMNNITIVAIDESNQTGTASGFVLYTLCGFGNDWQITVSDPMPNELIPRYIVDGIGDISMEVNLTWQGPGDAPALVGNPTLQKGSYIQVDDLDEYDFDWVKSIQTAWSSDHQKGYAMIKLKKIDPQPEGENWTMFEKENNISQNHVGSCTMPGMGCVKIPLEIAIEYTNPDKKYYSDNPEIPVTKRQKQCIDLQVTIQPRVNPDIIPGGFIDASIDILNTTVSLIDEVLPLIEDINVYLTYACLGMWGAWFITYASEWTSCKQANFAVCASCTDEQCSNLAASNPSDQGNCARCIAAKSKTLKVRDTLHQVCDRVMCPSAPTFRKYVVDTSNDMDLGASSQCSGLKINDMAAFQQKYRYKTMDELRQLEQECSQKRVIQTFYQGMTADEVKEANGGQNLDTECCELEYLYEYSTACGLGNVKMGLGNGQALDFFNEYIHSGCYDYKQNSKTIPADQKDEFEKECTGVKGALDSFSDFMLCKSGQQNGDEILIHDTSTRDRYFRVKNMKGGTVQEVAVSSVYQQDATDRYKSSDEQIKPRPLWDIQYDCETGKITWAVKRSSEVTNNPNGEKLPPAVYDVVCGGATDEYIVNPASDILRSFQCVCISAFASYLRMYRDMMMLMKNCFQEIKLTGDGSAGFCREIISIYVCDLVYWALDCLTNAQSSKPGVNVQREGIVGFFKYASGAGSDIRRQVTQRYGGSSLFQTMFVKRKLVHSVCMAAFTGDWDIDMGGMIREASYLPIKSTVVVAPTTRRFMAYDPLTGYTKHIYNVGLVIISGADIKYDVQLQCSASTDCPDMEGGYCDCFHKGAPQFYPITPQFGNGKLDAGQTLDKASYVVVEGNRLGSVRYDKVRVKYSYKDSSGNDIEEVKLVDISQVGSPPPAQCKFDIGKLAFMCAWDTSEKGDAWFEVKPTRDGTYGLGDYLNLEVDARTSMPQSADSCTHDRECTKWLRYSVKGKNEVGETYTLVSDKVIELPREGQYKKTADKGDSSGFVGSGLGGNEGGKITKDMFNIPASCPAPTVIRGKLAGTIDLDNCKNWPSTSLNPGMVVMLTPYEKSLNEQSSTHQFDKNAFYAISGQGANQVKEYFEDQKTENLGKINDWKKCEGGPTDKSGSFTGVITCNGYPIKLTNYPMDANESSSFLVQYIATTSNCEQFKLDRPASWEVTATIVGSENKGGEWQMSTTPWVHNKEPQQVTVKIPVVCVENPSSGVGLGAPKFSLELQGGNSLTESMDAGGVYVIDYNSYSNAKISVTAPSTKSGYSKVGFAFGTRYELNFDKDKSTGLIKPGSTSSTTLGSLDSGGQPEGKYEVYAYAIDSAGGTEKTDTFVVYLYKKSDGGYLCIPKGSNECGTGSEVFEVVSTASGECGQEYNACRTRHS